MYVPFLKIFIHNLYIKKILTIFHLVGKTVKACQSLRRHILALESNMEVFTKVLEPFVEVVMPEPDVKHVHSFDIDSPIKKCSKRLLECE